MRKRGFPIRAAIAVLALLAIALLLKLPMIAKIGPGYTAELTCACLFVGGRPEQSCKHDLDPLARGFVSLQIDATARSVAAGWTPARFMSRTAQYREGYGCSIDN